MMGQLENLDATSPETYYRGYMGYVNEVALKTDIKDLKAIIKAMLDAYEANRMFFFIGNGGSASTASHFCEDLAEVGRKLNLKLFRCISLTDNAPYITAAANDYGYDQIFVKQMEGLFNQGDVLISITASGNSPNVLEAIEFAKNKGGKTVGFLGFDGGRACQICDLSLVADTSKGEYGPAEDMHMIWVHLVTSFLYFKLREETPIE